MNLEARRWPACFLAVLMWRFTSCCALNLSLQLNTLYITYSQKMICPVYKDKPLVGAGEWTLASVVHNVELEEDLRELLVLEESEKHWQDLGEGEVG